LHRNLTSFWSETSARPSGGIVGTRSNSKNGSFAPRPHKNTGLKTNSQCQLQLLELCIATHAGYCHEAVSQSHIGGSSAYSRTS